MLLKIFILSFLITIFTGCSHKQPISAKSANVVVKTPNLKFYDKGFVEKYEDKVRLTILNFGIVIDDMTIYKDRVCKNLILCIDTAEFNSKYLDKSYEKDFFYNLFNDEDINFKDKENGILIKIIYDKKEDLNNTIHDK